MAEYPAKPGAPNWELRVRSGEVNVECRLTSFLYTLMRDHLPPGTVEELVRGSNDPDVAYTNGWLAKYAEDLAKRLKGTDAGSTKTFELCIDHSCGQCDDCDDYMEACASNTDHFCIHKKTKQ